MNNEIVVKEIGEAPIHIGDGNYSSKYPKASEFLSFGVPFISASDFSNGRISSANFRYISPKQHSELRKGHLKANDVLIVSRGNGVGQVAWVDKKHEGCNINAQLVLLRADEKELHSRYLYFLLSSKEYFQTIKQYASGSAQPQLTISSLTKVPLKYPSYESQIEIANFLASIDDKIELNNQMNETLEAMARAIFKEWFIDFGPVRAKAEGRRPFGMDDETVALFPDSFEESELGMIPKGWRVSAIAELTEKIQYGYTASASKAAVGPKFLRITDIQGGRCDWSAVPFCNASEIETQKYALKEGDIVVARTGASTGENMLIVDPPSSMFASYLVCFKFKSPAMSRFIASFMRTSTYFDFVANILGGSAQPNANAQQLASAKMALPSTGIIELFYLKIRYFEKMIRLNQDENTSLVKIRDLLLHKLISGELDLKGEA